MSDCLLPRIADGDAGAIDEFLTRYGGLVWSLARRMSANLADAEDAVQEVFIDLWKHAARVDENVASEATFITMIARRRLIDRVRKRSRRKPTTTIDEAIHSPAVEDKDRVELSEEAERIGEQMKMLRPEEQKVLQMSIFRGLSQSQIAEKTNMPLGTVKTHARRGLIRLRELLGVDASGDGKGGEG